MDAIDKLLIFFFICSLVFAAVPLGFDLRASFGFIFMLLFRLTFLSSTEMLIDGLF